MISALGERVYGAWEYIRRVQGAMFNERNSVNNYLLRFDYVALPFP